MGLALCKSLFTVGSQVTPDAGLWLALLGGGQEGKSGNTGGLELLALEVPPGTAH